MTTVQQLESNPFALMMNPEAVFAAMASSDRLARLHSRICRPLDKPLLQNTDDTDGDGADDSSEAMLDPSSHATQP